MNCMSHSLKWPELKEKKEERKKKGEKNLGLGLQGEPAPRAPGDSSSKKWGCLKF